MPKRVVDGDALWRSQKLRKVDPKFRGEVANLIPLGLANGAFEVDPALVWAQVYAFNRPDVTLDDVFAMLDQFEKAKMLFRWTDEREKVWGYWVGVDIPGRLPPPSERNREKRGMEPPQDKLREFIGGSYPAPMREVGGGSLCNGNGNGKGTGKGKGKGKGTGNGTEERTGQQLQQQFDESDMEEGESPLTVNDQFSVPYTDEVSVQFESDSVSTLNSATPPLPQIELDDIRNWKDDRFGITGDRLRNCICYQLDHALNNWYRTRAEITVSKMNSQIYVSKLDADTPPGWTPEKATANATKKPTGNGMSKAAREMVAKFGGKINE